MASKLASGKVTPQLAQQTCEALVPTMNASDRDDFMRCCAKRIQEVPGGKVPAKKKGDTPAQKM